ncbi:MAG: hypothetical protein KY476_08565 [Planctomycetes bacterium]|nr:hypothetical protein [Planctomycetota bacterium]
MPKLAHLRSQLQQLRRRRAGVRMTIAWAAVVVAVVVSLAAAFALDFSLEMDRFGRFISLVLMTVVVAWIFRRFTQPELGRSESEIDVALIVERNHAIDSDLVAALQFQKPEATRWGSPQLETAVIDYVEDYSSHLNVFDGFDTRRFKRSAIAAGTSLGVFLLAIAVFPSYAGAFFNRFFLGGAHYPTATIIERIELNGRATYAADGALVETVNHAYGQPLRFTVVGSGELPEAGTVRLESVHSGGETRIDLKRLAAAKQHKVGEGQAVYEAELPRLVDSVAYQVYLGDAWTDPLEIHVIPLPVVDVELSPRPPAYAASSASVDPAADSGALQIAVLEGSRVELRVSCRNKELKQATVTIGEREFPLVRREEGKRSVWTFETMRAARGTQKSSENPLALVTEPVRFSVQVVDADGLSLEKPREGYIRIKADRPPLVREARIASRLVLPIAEPQIEYAASDDYGLSRLDLKLQIVKADGETREETVPIVDIPGDGPPQRSLSGQWPLNLEPFGLEKGDELKLTLEAFDYRGELPPKSNVSEPLVLQVTDRQGILAGVGELDERSARELDSIIDLETGDRK